MVSNKEIISLKTIKYDLLIDKNISDLEIQEILTSNPSYKTKEIKNHLYLNYLDDGISLYFLDKKLTNVFLYNEGIQGYKQYKGKLPYNLSWDMKNKIIVEKFGDTKVKGGGNIPIWLSYNKLGIEFSFLGKMWADTDNVLTHITIFKREKSHDCSVCLKEIKTNYECDKKCAIVNYCSESCRNVHIKLHLKYCN